MSDTQTLIAFPGAAAYQPGALASSAKEHKDVHGVLSIIDEVSEEFGGGPVSAPLLDPHERDLPTFMSDDPIAFHLAIYAGSIAAFRARPRPQPGTAVLLGLSLGEIMALVAGGAYDLVSGARIVAHRTRLLCDRLATDTAVVLETDAERAGHLVGALADPALAVAVDNTATQTIVCGPAAAVERLRGLAGDLGLRTSPLATPFASHNPRYTEVSDRLWHLIKDLPQRPLRLPVYSPISGGFYRDADDLSRAVADHISRPVHLRAALESLRDSGIRDFVECGARLILTPLIGSILGSRAPRPAEPDQLPPPRTAAEADGGAAVEFEELREIYVEALGYPPEAFELGTDLEADLGITSMRQTEIITKVLDRFGLADLPEDFSVSAYPTLGRILDFVRAQAGTGPIRR